MADKSSNKKRVNLQFNLEDPVQAKAFAMLLEYTKARNAAKFVAECIMVRVLTNMSLSDWFEFQKRFLDGEYNAEDIAIARNTSVNTQAKQNPSPKLQKTSNGDAIQIQFSQENQSQDEHNHGKKTQDQKPLSIMADDDTSGPTDEEFDDLERSLQDFGIEI